MTVAAIVASPAFAINCLATSFIITFAFLAFMVARCFHALAAFTTTAIAAIIIIAIINSAIKIISCSVFWYWLIMCC
jgi:hypothetical protein